MIPVDGAILYDNPLQLGALHVKHRSMDADTNTVRTTISPQELEIDASLEELLSQMLTKDSERRLSLEDVRKHRWLESVDWDAVRARSVQPPYVHDADRDI